MSLEEFASRYRFLMSSRGGWIDTQELCQLIVRSYDRMSNEIRVGQTQIYATECGVELIEQWKQRTRHQMASVIQRWWREIVERRQAAETIQRWWRLVLRRKAAIRLQNWWRRKQNARLIVVNLQKLCLSVRIVQRAFRRWFHVRQRRKMLLFRQQEAFKLQELAKADEKTEDTECQVVIAPEKTENVQSAIQVRLPGNQVLKRFDYFYADGIVTIRRPLVIYFTL